MLIPALVPAWDEEAVKFRVRVSFTGGSKCEYTDGANSVIQRGAAKFMEHSVTENILYARTC